MPPRIWNVCCSLSFLFIVFPLVFVLCVITVTIPPLLVESTNNVDTLVMSKLGDVAQKISITLDTLFSRCALTQVVQQLHRDKIITMADTKSAFDVYARLIQAWSDVRWLDTTSPGGEWNSVENTGTGLNHMIHRPDSTTYDYFAVDPITLAPIPGTDAPGVENGTDCCGFVAIHDYMAHHNLTLDETANVVAWIPAYVWETQYLLSCTRSVFVDNVFVAYTTAYFELEDVALVLQSSTSTPSEMIFIVQPDEPPIIVCASDPNITLIDPDPANPGTNVAVPFAKSCPQGPELIPFLRGGNQTLVMPILGVPHYVSVWNYSIDPDHMFVVIQIVETSDYLGTINRNFMVVGWVIGGVCLLLLLCSAALSHMLTSPLTKMLPVLESVAAMNLEPIQLTSRFTEIRRIYVAFGMMVERLIEYRAFMPDTLFQQVESDEARLVAYRNAAVPPSCARVQGGDKGERCVVQVVEVVSDRDHPDAVSPEDSNPKVSSSDESMMPTRQSNLKTVALMTVDIARFHSIFNAHPALGASIFERMLNVVTKEATATHGTLLRFHGGNFVCVWNAALQCHSAHNAALEAARAVAGHAAILLAEDEILQLQRCRVEWTVGIGVTSGPAHCGNMGTNRNRVFNVVGTCVNLGAFLAKLAVLYQVPILADEATIRPLAFHSSQYVLIDVVPYPRVKYPVGRNGLPVYAITVERSSRGEAEWMYELETQRADPCHYTTEAFVHFLDNDLKTAQLLVDRINIDTAPPVVQRVLATLTELLRRARIGDLCPCDYVSPVPQVYI